MSGRKRRNHYFHNTKIPLETVATYAERLLDEIKERLSQALCFTREDLMHLPVAEFEHVATITRYQATSMAVRYLIDEGLLIRQTPPYLCLPERVSAVSFQNQATIPTEYEGTIRKLVRTMPKDKPFAVKHVVLRWRTDPQLTTDLKRRAIRVAIRRLAKQNICTQLNTFQYMVRGTSNG